MQLKTNQYYQLNMIFLFGIKNFTLNKPNILAILIIKNKLIIYINRNI